MTTMTAATNDTAPPNPVAETEILASTARPVRKARRVRRVLPVRKAQWVLRDPLVTPALLAPRDPKAWPVLLVRKDPGEKWV